MKFSKIFLEKKVFSKYRIAALLSAIVLFLFVGFDFTGAANKNDNENTNANTNSNGNLNSNSNINTNINSNVNSAVPPADLAKKQAEIAKKKEQLNSVRNQINRFEQKSDLLDKKTETIEQIIQVLDSEISEMEASLQKTGAALAEITASVNQKQQEVSIKEFEIVERKKILKEYVRKLNLMDRKSFLEVLLEKPRLSEYFREMESIVAFESRIKEMLDGLNDKKTELVKERETLEEQQNEQTSLYAMQEDQRITLEQNRRDREELLAETQTEQYKLGNAIDKQQEIASRLSAELTSMQSLGEKIDFGQALSDAQDVANLTGVRTAFLLGVLRVESNMGNNVGGGRYKTDMNPAQWDRFKSICTSLGYDPDDKPVSRKPCYRDSSGNCGGWGGAMGPAQFMPSTWMGYKDQIAQINGHNPPDPWNLRDALTAMGLKLAKVPGVTDHNRTAEHKAASIYLAGGNWERFGWYGDRVLKYADQFDAKIKRE